MPKGPSLDPAVKRLAMHVEDHPVEYGAFEGIIPQGRIRRRHGDAVGPGNLGADRRSAVRATAQGKLKFELHGEKLQGGWMLVRTGGRSSDKDQRQWLLFKERDDDAKAASEGDILDESPLSVSTGRGLDEIAADRDWVWGQKAKANGKPKSGGASQEIPRPLRRKPTSSLKARREVGQNAEARRGGACDAREGCARRATSGCTRSSSTATA